MGKPGKKAGKGKLAPTNVNRTTDRERTHLRDQRTIKRLKMYNSKIKRNEKGEIVKGSVLSASDRIEQTMARIAPDRGWFGNTRVIGQQALQKFREEMSERFRDPYSVVLKQKKLPLSLLEDAPEKHNIQQQMQFDNTFGEKSTRKRVKLGSSLGSMEDLANRAGSAITGFSSTRAERKAEREALQQQSGSKKKPVGSLTLGRGAQDTQAALLSAAASQHNNNNMNTNNNDNQNDDDNEGELSFDKRNWSLFKKGQSNRIWNELYKVIDSADVVVYVLDARDPMGTRSSFIEDYLRREKKHKHFVLVLNKCDLIPLWATARWLQIVSKDFPTIAFHASIDHPFGKGNLISILRQFSRLHNVTQRGRTKAPISVGVVGYPNVGKSSVINTLRRKTVCKSAPIPGETKIWQYIALTRSIFLIDCPGIVYDREGNSDINAVLKGVVRVERLGAADKSDVVQAVLESVKRRDIEATYGITDWHDANSFLEKLAVARGKLLPGGVPDSDIVARSVLYDWQRGKIPWFVPPPFDSDRAKDNTQNLEDSKLLSNIEKMNTLNVVDDQIVNDLGEEEKDQDDEEQEEEAVGDRRRPRENDDDEEEDNGEQTTTTTTTLRKTPQNSAKNNNNNKQQQQRNNNNKRGGGFSTVVSAAAAAEQNAKKQQQKEKRQEKMKQNNFATAEDNNNKNTAAAASSSSSSQKKNDGNQELWDAFVAASK